MSVARNHLLIRLLWSTQPSLDVSDEQFLERNALLESTGFCFPKN